MQERSNAAIEESLLTWHQIDHRAWEATYGRLVLRIEQTNEDDRWQFTVRHPVFGTKGGYARDAARAMAMAIDEGGRSLEQVSREAVVR